MSLSGASKAIGGVFFAAERGLCGALRVPGDKSISHRAVLLASVCSDEVQVRGFLRSADTLATVGTARALGVVVDEHGDGLVIHGRGWDGLCEPQDVIDVANSGTLIRLLPGLVASKDFLCVITGDTSIRRRPMRRVLEPLAAMGATVAGRADDSLPPICIRGGDLRAVDHVLAIASAQVKSALLFAGLRAQGVTSVREPGASRDHTERMIVRAGGRVQREDSTGGAGVVHIWPAQELRLEPLDIPGDFSSAAFLIVGALLVPGSEVIIEDVGLNPTRIGLLSVLQRMGADITVEVADPQAFEPAGRVTARFSQLSCTDIQPHEIPGLIDELPILLLAAARAKGTSSVTGAGELRVKESDRLAAMAKLLASLGVGVVEHGDGLAVEGKPEGWQGGVVHTQGDHRLAMVGAIAGFASKDWVSIDDLDCMQVSFPGFTDTVTQLGAEWEVHPQDTESEERRA